MLTQRAVAALLALLAAPACRRCSLKEIQPVEGGEFNLGSCEEPGCSTKPATPARAARGGADDEPPRQIRRPVVERDRPEGATRSRARSRATRSSRSCGSTRIRSARRPPRSPPRSARVRAADAVAERRRGGRRGRDRDRDGAQLGLRLRVLDLWNNGIGPDGAARSRALQGNHMLLTLEMRGNRAATKARGVRGDDAEQPGALDPRPHGQRDDQSGHPGAPRRPEGEPRQSVPAPLRQRLPHEQWTSWQAKGKADAP